MSLLISSFIILVAGLNCVSSSDIVRIEDPLYENVSGGCKIKQKHLLCDCSGVPEQNVFLEAHSPSDITNIRVSNCQNVVFGVNAIRNKRFLQTITLRNISNLVLENFSIYKEIKNKGQSLIVKILNSNISNIPSFSFKGIKDLLFTNVIINTISPYAMYSVTNMYSLRFFATKIGNIKNLAFNKVMAKYFILNGCNFQLLSANAFSEIYITENFFIMYSTMNNIGFNALNIREIKMMNISNTHFTRIHQEAFKIQAANVSFKNVTFSGVAENVFKNIQSPYTSLDRKAYFNLDSVTFDYSYSRVVV